MDALQAFLEAMKKLKIAENHFLGLVHILIGRKISLEDGTQISNGMTWRDAAALLKKVRWNKDLVKELGMEEEKLAPRDRERFWYIAISRAGVDSKKAREDGDILADLLKDKGYIIGPAPSAK